SRRRHTRFSRDWSSDVCSSDLNQFLSRTECGRITCSPKFIKGMPDHQASVVSILCPSGQIGLEVVVRIPDFLIELRNKNIYPTFLTPLAHEIGRASSRETT